MALAGISPGEGTLAAALITGLLRLVVAVAELRAAQQHAAQAAAARAAAEHLHAASAQARVPAAHPGQAQARRRGKASGGPAGLDFPVPLRPGRVPPAGPGPSRPTAGVGPLP